MLTSGSLSEGTRGGSTGRGLEGDGGDEGVGGGGECRVEGPGRGECWPGTGKEVRGDDRRRAFLGSPTEVEGSEAVGADGRMLSSGRSGIVPSSTS